MKRMLLTLLAAFGLIVPSLRAQDVWDGTTIDTSWYGDGSATSYDISTPAQLAGLAKLVNEGNTFEGKTITLSANVDLAGKEWTPIGNGVRSGSSYTGAAFKGTFKTSYSSSRYRTISGLSIKTDPGNADAALGLFGVVDGGTVQYFTLSRPAISLKSAACVGGVVGLLVGKAKVYCVTVSGGSVAAYRGVGGIVGRMTISGTIDSCTNSAAVKALVDNGGGANAGGIVGAAYYTGASAEETMTISSCSNSGAVTAAAAGYVGGIVGFSAATVTKCKNSGTVKGNGDSVGGIVGEQQNFGGVSECTNTANVTNDSTGKNGTGGIVGWVRYSGSATDYPTKAVIAVTNNVNNGAISGGISAGGIVGHLFNAGSVTGNTNDAQTLASSNFIAGIVGCIQYQPGNAYLDEKGDVTIQNNATTTAEEQFGGTGGCKHLVAYDNDSAKEQGTVIQDNADLTLPGAGTEQDPYAIASLEQLKRFRDAVNRGVTYTKRIVKLTASIDLNNEEWTPIGTKDNSFQGTFDGDGKTISNLKVTGEASYVGLFGKISDPAKLSKLTVENASVAGLDNVGALVGAAYTGTVEDCHVKGKLVIEGKYMVGGLVGSGYADIYNCSVRGTAENPAIVTATYREQNLEGDNVGGLVGYRGEGKGIETIGCSVEYVKVTGSRKVGGLIGSAFQNNVIEGCSVANATIVCGASSDYAIDNQKTLGFGGLVGLYTAYGQSDGTLFECAVSDITFEVPDGITCSTGVVTGGLRGSSVPVVPSDSMTIANVTTSGTNTGATNDYLADAPTYVYPETFDSASAFINDFPEGKTVYDGEKHHATMVEALKAIHLTGKNTLWCKPGADVGTISHGHVCQSLTVYGNGAYFSGVENSGARDFELDTFKLDGCAGIQGELSLAIHALNNVGVWGQRKTAHTLNISLVDCKNINRVYITGTTGMNNITLKNCSASYVMEKAEKSNSCTVYSNAPGAITVENCTFTSVAQPICLNNNSGATQNVTVKSCTFTDCGTEATFPNLTSSVEVWASPIRVLTTVEGSVTNLRVDTCAFAYAEGATKCNGDILLGNGAENGKSFPTVTATIVNTTAEVQVQQPGDHPTGEVSAKPTKVVKVEASATETVVKNTLPVAEVDGVAYDTLPEVMTAIENKVAAGATAVTVKLLSDVSVENTMLSIPNGLALTLDLNGKTYTYTDDRTGIMGDNAARYAVYLGATSTLTVTDSSAEQTGTIRGEGTALHCLNNDGGTLIVRGGRFVCANMEPYPNGSSYAISSRGDACTLEPEAGKTIVCTGGLKAATGTVRIAGETTINGQGAYYAIYVGEQSGSPSASIEIAGGTFTAGSNGLAICVDTDKNGVQAKAMFDISDGTFTGAFGGTGIGTYTLSGGSYSVDPTTTVKPSTVTLKPNYLPMQNADDYYDVGPFVVAITEGDAKGGYRTLQEAVDAVSALDPTPTITLLRDVVLEDTVTLTKNISIDLVGHTLYAKDGNTPAFKADTKVTVTFVKEEGAEAVKGSFIAAAQKTGAPNVTISGLEPLAITKWTDVGAYDISWYEDVVKDAGNEALSFTISTVREFAGLASLPANPFMAGDTITLTGDIDLSALEWVPPAYGFLAELDGAGHQISGLWTGDEATTGCTGLFAYIAPNGIVKNLRLSGATIVAKSGNNPAGGRGTVQYAGVFAGVLDGTIQNCVATECTVTVKTPTTPQGFGGIAGTGSGTIEDCVVSGVTFAGSSTTGSFVGAGSATITNCYVDGALTQTSGTLTNVYAKNAEGRFVRHNTGDGTLPPETLGAGAALNGIGWLLNGQKTEDTTAWRVDSNEGCTTLLPFKADGVEVIPDVERRLTKSERIVPFPEGGYWYVYFANGHKATVKLNAEGKTVLTTTRDDYLVDEELELKANWAGSIDSQVAVFGGCNGGTLNGTNLTIEATKGTLKRVFGGSYSADATASSITGTAILTITGGTVEKAYGGSCGDASTVTSGAKLTLNGGTVTTAVATSNGGEITGKATLEVASGVSTAAKLVAMERGTAENVTFTMKGVATGGICLSAESANAKVSVTGTVELYNNKVADQGKVYLGAALAEIKTVKLRTYSSSYPITVLAQTAAKDKVETVTIPEGKTVQIQSNVTLQVPANVTLEVAGKVSISGKLVGTSGTSLLEVLEGASATSLPQGLSSWDVATSKWVQAQIEASNGTYYGTVAQALAALSEGATVTLLSRSVATSNVLATSAGKTVFAGAAYDVADVLGGVFTVTLDENNTKQLVYAYDLGVGGLTIRRAAEGETAGTDGLVVEVTVKLAEGEVAPSRELADCTLTVTSILDKDANTKQDFKLEGLTFTNGECKVTIPYEKMGLGTNRLTVSVSKGEATPPAEGGGETP